MAVYNLTGAGTQALSAEVSRIFVDVTAFNSNDHVGSASPPNYYKLGLLRFGVQGAYGPVYPIDSASMYLDLDAGVTTLGYSLFGVTAIRVTEQFGSFAPGGVHVSGLTYNGTVAADSAIHTLVTYTVPAGDSALLEALWFGVGIGTTSTQGTVNISTSAGYLAYETVIGPLNAAAVGEYWSPQTAIPQLRLNAGEAISVAFTNTSSGIALPVITSMIVLQYPQAMW